MATAFAWIMLPFLSIRMGVWIRSNVEKLSFKEEAFMDEKQVGRRHKNTRPRVKGDGRKLARNAIEWKGDIGMANFIRV